MSTKIITADLDEIVAGHLGAGSGQASPLWTSEDPAAVAALARFASQIKGAYIAYWAGLGVEVVDCPDADFMDKVASGQIDADDIYEATAEEEEAAFLAAWSVDEDELAAAEAAVQS